MSQATDSWRTFQTPFGKLELRRSDFISVFLLWCSWQGRIGIVLSVCLFACGLIAVLSSLLLVCSQVSVRLKEPLVWFGLVWRESGRTLLLLEPVGCRLDSSIRWWVTWLPGFCTLEKSKLSCALIVFLCVLGFGL